MVISMEMDIVVINENSNYKVRYCQQPPRIPPYTQRYFPPFHFMDPTFKFKKYSNGKK